MARLYEFLALANKPVAARVMQALTKAPTILLTNPRIGDSLSSSSPRGTANSDWGVRASLRIQDSFIYVLRLWHTRETVRNDAPPNDLLFAESLLNVHSP